MPTTSVELRIPAVNDTDNGKLAKIQALVQKGVNLLPQQGPITAFVFLNTLQALEDLPFDQGVKKGGRLFGCHPYLPEERYRHDLERGRIEEQDIDAVLTEDLGTHAEETIAQLFTRFELRKAMLTFPLRTGPSSELGWFMSETDALKKWRPEAPITARTAAIEQTRHWVMRDLRNAVRGHDVRVDDHGEKRRQDKLYAERASAGLSADEANWAERLRPLFHKHHLDSIERWTEPTWEALTLQMLWQVCENSTQQIPPTPVAPPSLVRHRDWLLEYGGEDSDALVHELLIRFSASYADQGFASWSLPNRELGFFKAFVELYRQGGGPPDRWLNGLGAELDRIEKLGLSPLECIAESLILLNVPEAEWEEYITSSLIALRGWAALLNQMDVRGDRVPLPAKEGTIYDYLAIRLILERLAVEYVAARSLSKAIPLADLRAHLQGAVPHPQQLHHAQRAFLIFQLMQVMGIGPSRLAELTRDEWIALLAELEGFSGLERRRCFHLAFERNFRIRALDAFSIHTRKPAQRPENPRFQAVFCIDTREESFRRHLVEAQPEIETFGSAGFFDVAMYFRGAADAHYQTLCPIVVKPQHWLTEEVVLSLEDEDRRRAKTRKAIGTASHRAHVASRNFASGALLTAGVGVLASVPLVMRVLFPRWTALLRTTANRFVEPPPITRLRLERSTEKPGPVDDGIGFNLDEMIGIGERFLRAIGLTTGFARLVAFFGHGSFCLNNPHKSAYDCGACSGSAGGPNARALAAMLNDPRVRTALKERGIHIPETTRFLGGLHNTAKDSITFSDLDLLPASHQSDLNWARAALREACQRNAHERCRRFQSAPLSLTPAQALQHVEGRAEDLAQTRPEFGNATNAMAYVGRHARARGLYLDRRCFFQSYDPLQDTSDHAILARILGAVVPVCSGINLQYFFSYIDSPGWGSGTKLPHNVTSLLGVMDGAASDMRMGLPWQGVEIHEPVRLLILIESTPEAIASIMQRNEVVGRILRNGWVQLALLDPHSSTIQVYDNGTYRPYEPSTDELPQSTSSIEWYRGWRDHLGFAEIGDA